MSDKLLREKIKQNPFNGEYAILICRSCEGYKMSLDGSTDDCRIINKCDNCKKGNGIPLGESTLAVNNR